MVVHRDGVELISGGSYPESAGTGSSSADHLELIPLPE
jgi:hypothetical protein